MTVDLSTRYLGLTLRNPLVVAASPLSGQSTNLQRLEQAGAAAVVLGSLFAEQLRRPEAMASIADDESYVADGPHVSDLDDYNAGPDSYLRYIAIAKKTVAIPIIGSLNGSSRGEWVRFRAADPGGWRRCAGSEHLLCANRRICEQPAS